MSPYRVPSCGTCDSVVTECTCALPSLPAPSRRLTATTQPVIIDPQAYLAAAKQRALERRQRARDGMTWRPEGDSRPTVPVPK